MNNIEVVLTLTKQNNETKFIFDEEDKKIFEKIEEETQTILYSEKKLLAKKVTKVLLPYRGKSITIIVNNDGPIAGLGLILVTDLCDILDIDLTLE